MATVALLLGFVYKVSKKNDEDQRQKLLLIPERPQTECARYSDKFIDSAVSRIEEGVKSL
jgi:hypothetical protein